MSLHPPSGGWSTSPAILTARQPPVVGFLLQCVQGGRGITTEHKDATQSKHKPQITHNCTDAKQENSGFSPILEGWFLLIHSTKTTNTNIAHGMRYGKLHISLVSHVVLYHCVYQPACIEVLQEKQEIKLLWGNIK